MTETTNDLEQRIKGLEEQLADLRNELAEARLDEWKGRIDEMELQLHLASMDAQTEVAPLLEQVRNRWLDAREQVTKAGSIANDRMASLRDGVQQAFDDLRAAVRDASRPGSA